MKYILLFIIVGIVGCSSGVVQMDKGTYMISEKAGGCGFATAGGQEADAYRKANRYCDKQGQKVETISVDSIDGKPMVRCASVTLKFKCVQ